MFMYRIICKIYTVYTYILDDSRATMICPFDTEHFVYDTYISYDICIVYRTILITMSVPTILTTSSFLFFFVYTF